MLNPLTRNEMKELESLRDAFIEEMDEMLDDKGNIKISEMQRHAFLRGKVMAIQDILETYDGRRQAQEEMDRSSEHKRLAAEYVKSQASGGNNSNPLDYGDYKQALQGEGWAIGDYTNMIAKSDKADEKKMLTHIKEEEQEHMDMLILLMSKYNLYEVNTSLSIKVPNKRKPVWKKRR